VKAAPSIAGLDLTTDNEATRRALFALVVRDNFTASLDPDVWIPPYTAEEAGLEVRYLWGRWFTTWVKLEEPASLVEGERRELLRLERRPGDPGGLFYRGV